MGIHWGSLLEVAVVALAVAVAVAVLVAFAIVGLSARERAAAGVNGGGTALNATTGTALAAVCLLATLAIVGYGLYIIIS
jgi:hypothetical protein